MHTVFALLCFVVVIHWLIFPYPYGLLHWHCGNLTIAPVPAMQPWWIWKNTSCEFIMNDSITTTKQSTTKPCAYFWGYTVFAYPYHNVNGGLTKPPLKWWDVWVITSHWSTWMELISHALTPRLVYLVSVSKMAPVDILFPPASHFICINRQTIYGIKCYYSISYDHASTDTIFLDSRHCILRAKL